MAVSEPKEFIDNNKSTLLTTIKEACISKDYFQGHSIPPEQFLDVIINDYLETIIICYESNSLLLFREKLEWFKNMYISRKGNINDYMMHDFFNEVKSAILSFYGNHNISFNKFLEDMEDTI